MKLDIENIGEAELLAYVDGQLDPQARELVERYLSQHPDKAAEIAQWQRQSAAIKGLYDHVGREPVPERLDPRRIARTCRAANDNNWRMAAAAVILLAFGATIGWYGRDLVTPGLLAPQTLMTAAVDAHELFVTQAVHPVEVRGEESAHLTTWLSANLDRRLVMPDLSKNGYGLVGGRLLPTAAGGTAAQIMYESGDRRITLYLTPKTPEQPLASRYAWIDDTAALYWANSAVTCTIVGDLPRAEMEEIASEVFKALNWQNENYQIS